MLALLAMAGAAAGVIYFQPSRSDLPDARESLNRMMETGRKIGRTPPRELFDGLRGKVAGIQENWEKLSESGELERRLEALREDLASKRDAAGEAGRKSWDELVTKSEEALKHVRERAADAPKEVEEILAGIRKLEGREDNGDTEDGEGPEADPASSGGYRIDR